jgi:hypothetical protein
MLHCVKKNLFMSIDVANEQFFQTFKLFESIIELTMQ